MIYEPTHTTARKIARIDAHGHTRPITCIYCKSEIRIGRMVSHGVFIGGRLHYICGECEELSRAELPTSHMG